VEEQHRRVGKLHKHELDKELDKRFTRIIKAPGGDSPPQGFLVADSDSKLFWFSFRVTDLRVSI
jgi:hypothetical protein